MRYLGKKNIAKFVGMALFELTVASTVYKFVQKNDLGVKLEF